MVLFTFDNWAIDNLGYAIIGFWSTLFNSLAFDQNFKSKKKTYTMCKFSKNNLNVYNYK